MFKGIRYLLRFDWQEDKGFIGMIFLASLLGALLPLLNALLPGAVYRSALVGKGLVPLSLVLGGYTLLRAAISLGVRALSQAAFVRRTRLAARFGTRLHEQLCQADYSSLEDPDYLTLKGRADKFIYADWHGFSYQVDQLFSLIGQAVSVGLLLFILAGLPPWLLLSAFALSLLGAWLTRRLRRQEAAHTLEAVQAERQWQYYGTLYDQLPHAKDIRIYGLTDWLTSKELRFADGVSRVYAKRSRVGLQVQGLSILCEALSLLLMLAYLVPRFGGAGLNAGELLSYVYAMYALVGGLQDSVESLAALGAYEVFYQGLADYLEMTRARSGKGRQPLPGPPYTVRFEGVCFRYPGQSEASLRDICCTLRQGEQVGLVGVNGAGKTTFMKLLLGLYTPTAGRIFLNDIDVSDLDPEAYRGLFACVFQDYQLFNFSLRDNLCLGRAVQEEQIWRTLSRLQLDALVRRQAEGLDSQVGRLFDARGFIPSGGEGQRLALCRAYLHDRPILALDEPSSALDARLEDALYQDARAMAGDKLVLMITHRLASAKDCDNILVLDQGRLVEQGSHAGLIRAQGHYSRLYMTQVGHYQQDQ